MRPVPPPSSPYSAERVRKSVTTAAYDKEHGSGAMLHLQLDESEMPQLRSLDTVSEESSDDTPGSGGGEESRTVTFD